MCNYSFKVKNSEKSVINQHILTAKNVTCMIYSTGTKERDKIIFLTKNLINSYAHEIITKEVVIMFCTI